MVSKWGSNPPRKSRVVAYGSVNMTDRKDYLFIKINNYEYNIWNSSR